MVSNIFKKIYLIHRWVPNRVVLEVMAMRGESTLLRAPEQEPQPPDAV